MICLRYAGNREAAEDMLQNGLVKIFTTLKKFDINKGSFPAWSNKVMVNEALQYLRKWKKLSYTNGLEDVNMDFRSTVDIYSELSAKDLMNMIQQLPDGYRTVFNLYSIEGYSHKEIAQQLGISQGTSKSQLSKAKKLLRQWVEVLM